MKWKVFGSGMLVLFGLFIVAVGCKKESNPTDAMANNNPTNQSTPTPVAISGPLEVYVTDNWNTYPTPASTPVLNSVPVVGVTVLAVPPSHSVTYSQKTQPDGKAYFIPTSLEIGNWTLTIPQQPGFPYAKSTQSASVTAAYETIPFASAPASLIISPVNPPLLTSNQGGTIVANVTYQQPGNLLVPVGLTVPSSLPSGWSVTSGPASIGFANSDFGSVTFIGVPCVDHAVPYSVNAQDFEATPVVRAMSDPATITKSFTSTVSCSYQQNNYVGNCCSGDGYIILTMTGTLTFSSTNACGNLTVWWVSGDCNTQGMQIGGSSNSAQDCGGGSFSLSPGSYSLTVNNTRYQPRMYVSFQGTTYGPYYFQLNSTDSHQFFSISY